MKTRTEIIKELETILSSMKDEGVEDANDWAVFKAVCDIEDAINHLKENEE